MNQYSVSQAPVTECQALLFAASMWQETVWPGG
jgi:hypothetical protein